MILEKKEKKSYIPVFVCVFVCIQLPRSCHTFHDKGHSEPSSPVWWTIPALSVFPLQISPHKRPDSAVYEPLCLSIHLVLPLFQGHAKELDLESTNWSPIRFTVLSTQPNTSRDLFFFSCWTGDLYLRDI